MFGCCLEPKRWWSKAPWAPSSNQRSSTPWNPRANRNDHWPIFRSSSLIPAASPLSVDSWGLQISNVTMTKTQTVLAFGSSAIFCLEKVIASDFGTHGIRMNSLIYSWPKFRRTASQVKVYDGSPKTPNPRPGIWRKHGMFGGVGPPSFEMINGKYPCCPNVCIISSEPEAVSPTKRT